MHSSDSTEQDLEAPFPLLPMRQGRPNVTAVLKSHLERHPEACDVGVFIAGKILFPHNSRAFIVQSKHFISRAVDWAVAIDQQIITDYAGPEGMAKDVMQACTAHNDVVGLCGRPWVHAVKHTYNL